MKKLHTVYNEKRFRFSSNMEFWFCIISLLGFLTTVLCLFFSHGNLFSRIFFEDILDTGMDFFHSIEYTRGRSPYDYFGTLYPPLANLFFYVLYRFVPIEQSSQWKDTFIDSVKSRGTSVDLRVWQSTMMLYICFIFLSVAALFLMTQVILNRSAKSGLVGLCIVISYGVLYAFERGNIIIISVFCCMFFAAYKDSENKVLSELSLVMLAIGAGLKIYPAIFGMLLVYDKQYVKALRTVFYGVFLFVVPVFAFHEGIGGISKFINILFSFIDETKITSEGYSFDKILNAIALLISNVINCELSPSFWNPFSSVMKIIVTVFILIKGFFVKKKWQKILVCAIAFLLYQTQGIYALTFLSIPLLFMMREEKLCKDTIIPYTALLFTQIMLPIWESENSNISIIYLRFQICMLILSFYILLLKTPSSKRKDQK